MPGQLDESRAIFRWLSDEVSSDTYVNIMGQYRPQYEVGQIAKNGSRKYEAIDRAPDRDELPPPTMPPATPACGGSTSGGRNGMME